MAKFSYKAKQGPAKIVDGVVDAENATAAVKKILAMGLSPMDVTLQPAQPLPGDQRSGENLSVSNIFSRRVPRSALVLFTRQLCDLVEASVPILRVLQLVEKQTRHAQLKSITGEMLAVIKDGGSLSEALGRYPDVFPRLYVNMVRAGEVSGQLGLVLNRLANLLERDQETQLRVRASLAYPFFIFGVGVISVIVLLTFVIPRLSVIFDDFDQALPLPTVAIMNASDFLNAYWWLVLAVGIFVYLYGRRFLLSAAGKVWFSAFQLRQPILGKFIQEVEIGRFARTAGTLVESGVVIIEALNSVKVLFENEVLRREIDEAVTEVANGSSFAAALKKHPHFPEAAVNMIAVGEETGHLEKGLYKLADSLERQADATAKVMVSLIGPIFLVFVVGFIGMIVIAMLLPIFQMNLIIQ